jgi:hypothetical protein
MKGALPPGLLNGWAHSNMSITAKNMTHPVAMNGTRGIVLGWVAINASSNDQNIRNVAFNESVAQIIFDREGSVKLIINSSMKPAKVFADNLELLEAQSSAGLTPESEAWVYDQNGHTITIFADPSSVTLVYSLTPSPPTTPVAEYPTDLALILAGCLAAILTITKRNVRKKGSTFS